MRVEVPVAPDAPEARDWAREELSRRMYDDSPGLLSRIWDRVLDGLGTLFTGTATLSPNLLVVVMLGVVVVAVVLSLVLAGPVRRRRVARSATTGALFDDDRDSRDLRAAADAALRAGDLSLAVVERFRAIVRSMDERSFIEDRTGLTAHEAAGLGGAALPSLGPALRAAGELFDAVRFGDHRATEEDHAGLVLLDRQVLAAPRPGGDDAPGPDADRATVLPPSLEGVLG